MTNFQVYRKVLPFSFIEFLVDLLEILLLAGTCTAGFFILNRSTEMGLLGLLLGFIVGIIFVVLINIFISNRIKAAQISMMVKGVTEDKLPDHTVKAGFAEIRGRFGKITLFFMVTNAIKSVFRQLGRALTHLTTMVGGDAGNAVGSAIDSAIQTLIGYLCDCCLGWILYRKEVNAWRAGAEGTAIFFKHGKTLIRNVGRIFGMGILSFILIGGAFTGLGYLIFSQFPGMFETLSHEIIEFAQRNTIDLPTWVSDINLLTLAVAAILAIVLWACLHGVLVRPFILTGVMRNFMAAGIKDHPTEEDFAAIAQKAPKFAKFSERM